MSSRSILWKTAAGPPRAAGAAGGAATAPAAVSQRKKAAAAEASRPSMVREQCSTVIARSQGAQAQGRVNLQLILVNDQREHPSSSPPVYVSQWVDLFLNLCNGRQLV